MPRSLALYARLAVSALLVAWLIHSVDIPRPWPAIDGTGWLYVALVALLMNADRVLMAYKWSILLRAKQVGLPFAEVVRSYYIATFWGAFLPTSLGGDAVRAYRVSKQTRVPGEIISSIVLERSLGVAATFVVGTLSAILFTTMISSASWKMAMAVGIAFLVFLVAFAVSLDARLGAWLDRLLARWDAPWVHELRNIYSSYQAYRECHRPMLRSFAWSVVEQFLPVATVLLMAAALHMPLPLWSAVVFVPLILALSRMPISVNGFGVSEGLFVYFFAFAGVREGDAFLLGLASHLLAILAVVPGFVYYSLSGSSPAVAPK